MVEKAVSVYKEKVPLCVVFSSIIASLVGFIFGYVGVFGVLNVEDVFYDLFVTDAFRKNPRDFDYCKYSSRGFRFPLYAGPLYLGGSIASLFAYPFITKHGPRKILLFSAYVLFVGTLANAFPYVNIAGLIVLGVGIGFGIQACLQYISEIAPARLRGNYTTYFQLSIAVGILAGNMIEKDYGEFGIQAMIIGWGLPIIPALVLGFGAKFCLSETPRTLIGQDKAEEARKVLQKLRGTDDVEAEFRDITASCDIAGETRRLDFRISGNILLEKNRPQLVAAILVPAFQNLTGVLFVFVYAPLMFKSLGSENSKYALYSLAINGTTLVVSALVCSVTVDKFGRKKLLILGGVLMTLCQVIIAIILGSDSSHSKDTLAVMLTVLMGIFVMSYGLSWGPLGWSIPSELFTRETRAIGQSIAVSTNLLFTYIVLQFFIPLLCAFKYGLFLFFGGWIVVMTVFVYFLLPETKGLAIEEVGWNVVTSLSLCTVSIV